MELKVRKARKSDSNGILQLIIELAKFEKLEPPNEKAKRRLLKHAFGKNRSFYVLLLESDNKIIGYAFYFFTYSSFLARKTLYLEDIFITGEKRRSGAGKVLMEKLLKIAGKEKCGRMEWCVLDWNKNAINFYDKLGAKPLKDWIYYRIDLRNSK